MTKYLTPNQVAGILGVTERTVYELAKLDILPAIKVGRLWRVHPDEVAAHVEYLKTQPSGPAIFVYFLRGRATRHIKIGMARDVSRRVRDLQAGSPDILDVLGVISERLFGETDLHRRFKADRLHGEWFRETPDLLSFIAECTSQSRTETAA